MMIIFSVREENHAQRKPRISEKRPTEHAEASPQTPVPDTTETVTIVFSADFANGEGCSSAKDAAGCDLYLATITTTGSVQNVTKLTDTLGIAESFPAWHPTKNIIYFNSQNTSTGQYEQPSISYWNTETNEGGTLIKYGAHPSVMPDRSAIIYNDVPKHILKTAPLAADGESVSTATALVDGENRFEPTVSGDGNLVVFHETSAENAGASIYNIATNTVTNISPSDGTGHCTINAATTLAVCDQKSGGGLAGTSTLSSTIGMTSLLVPDPTIPAISALDDDYTSCGFASVNFPNFLDDDTLIVSISCNSRDTSEPTFAKLFLVELSDISFIPLGKNLTKAYNGTGRSSRTAAAQQ